MRDTQAANKGTSRLMQQAGRVQARCAKGNLGAEEVSRDLRAILLPRTNCVKEEPWGYWDTWAGTRHLREAMTGSQKSWRKRLQLASWWGWARYYLSDTNWDQTKIQEAGQKASLVDIEILRQGGLWPDIFTGKESHKILGHYHCPGSCA